MEKSILEPEPPKPESRVHALLQVDISSSYITPRGLNVENQGVIFQPLVLVFWDLYKNDAGFIKDVTLTTGVWNSIHTKPSGAVASEFNETDPIVGLTFALPSGFKIDTFFTAFISQTDSYDTSTNFSLKLTYNDSAFGSFSINPFLEYWAEISEKATVVFDPATSSEGYYFVLGMNPTYQFTTIPVKVEVPLFANFVSDNFYQRFDGSDGGSGFALFSAQVKVSTPLSFIPSSYGNWTLYAGVKYYHLDNTGLLDGNQVLATAQRDKDLIQFSGGINVFF
jgi:hypothetical protein